MNNLQQLDEALDYLNCNNIEPVNEGIIQKLLDYREKKRKEKALKEKDKKDIQERGYTDYQYKSAKENLKSFVDWENDKPINIMIMNNFDLPSALFYCNISESQFITSFNKFITDQDPVNADDFPLDESDPVYKLLNENECYEIGDTIGTPYLLYFNKLKKFMIYYNDYEDSPDNLMTYKELIEYGKEYISEINRAGGYTYHNQFAKAYKAADKALGYNRLK